jgi:serine protease Do
MIRKFIIAFFSLSVICASDAPSAPLERNRDRVLAQQLLATYVFVASGSGVVISRDGYILTNFHVIDNEDDYTVRFANGTVKKTTLVGVDPVGDMALLKIANENQEEVNFPYAEFASPDSMRLGSDVIAVGNPFGLGDLDDTPTYTAGVLSAVRIVRGDYTDVVQSDAPVNPGNSGGPLFDQHGKLLGINGQIRTVSGFRANSGIGLAIASTQLQAFLPYLKNARCGYVHHTAEPKGIELQLDDAGVEVVKPGESPLSAGDILLTIAGRPVTSVATALGLFASLPFEKGVTIPVSLVRQGTQQTLLIPAARTTIPGRPYHGISIDERGGAIMVSEVDDDSPASANKIQRGDIIEQANGRDIKKKIDWLKAIVPLEIGDYLEITLKNKAGERRTLTVLLRPRS